MARVLLPEPDMKRRLRPVTSQLARLVLVVVIALTLVGCGRFGRRLLGGLLRVGAVVAAHAIAAAVRGTASGGAPDRPLPPPPPPPEEAVCSPDRVPACGDDERSSPGPGESPRDGGVPMPAAPPPIPER